MSYVFSNYKECLLCGRSSDDGGGSLVKHSGDSNSNSYLLWFCLDCLEDCYSEVKAKEDKIIKEKNLVKLL